MDGIVAYLLSKKFTKDTVVGMGAIKGAACQVQSVNKVGKTTTITLKWEDNAGTSHTQSFDIEDGLDGVSVQGATIDANGHLKLTLSNGTVLDCGQVLPQYDTMPSPSASNVGQILQYIGTTTTTYTNGYFYQCINDGGVYKWVEKLVQDSYTKSQIGNLSDLPDNTKNVVENIENIKLSIDQLQASKLSISDIDDALSDTSENPVQNKVIKLTLDQLRGSILNKLDEKEDKFRYSTMPTASIDNVNKTVEYIGVTNTTYTNGYFYQCRFDGTNYSWVQKNVQPSSGSGGGDGVVDGYYNSTDQLFYEDSSYSNPISGDNNTLYTSLDTNLLYRYNGIIFIRVDDSGSGEDDVINGYYNISNEKFYADSSYTTEIVGEVGKIYISVDTNIQYRWDNISVPNKFVTISSSIDVDNALSTTSENPVQNKVITLAIDQLQGSVLQKIQKKLSANADDFAIFTNDGDIADSGISKNIVPTTATSSNKLATLDDIPENLDDLDDVVITNPQPSQIIAYNGTSGKWENKTGQETIGGVVIQGSIMFANLPTTGMSNGDAYDIKDAFVTDSRFEEGAGISCGAGTDVVWIARENKWNILTPSGVYSFNGRTGAVIPATSDYDAEQIDYDNTTSGLTATNAQDGIDELSSKKADKVTSATNGHLAGLDANGNLTDSGVVANDVIQKVATATGLLKDDGTVDTTTYAPSANAYLVGDTVETTIDDADYFPFYDTSATGKRKTLWSNIKAKLKSYFDGLYATLISSPTNNNLVAMDANGNIKDSGKKLSDLILQWTDV